MRRDRLVERGGRRAARPGGDDPAVAAIQPEHAADEGVHGGRERRQHPDHLVGKAHGLDRPPGQPSRGQRGQRGGPGGGGRNGSARGQLAAVRRQVKQDGQQLGAGGAVNRGVVDLGVDRGALPGQAGDQVDLPQGRLRSSGRACSRADLLGQLSLRARPRQRDLADVVLDVEVGSSTQ